MKYKKQLVPEIKKELKDESKQVKIKKKYKVKDDKNSLLIVEKSYFVSKLLKTVLGIALYILAFIGIIALIYPELRTELFKILSDIIRQIKEFI